MRRLLLIIVITAMGLMRGYSQSLVQTYVDRCTGQVSVFTVPMNGQTVVAFYNKSRVFTADEFRNGTLQAWLEETWLWWNALSPCSTTGTTVVNTTQQTQQTTQQATEAATNATQIANQTASTQNIPDTNTIPDATSTNVSVPSTTEAPTTSIPDTTTSTPDTSVPDTTTSTPDTSTPDTTSTQSTGTEPSSSNTQPDSTSTESSASTEATSTEGSTEATSTEASSSGEGSQETSTESTSESTESSSEVESTETESTETESTETESTESTEESTTEESTEESSTEESTEETTEESTEESTEEETTEESTEEESTEEESTEEETENEESDEEQTEEESDEESEENSEEESDEEESDEEESNEEEEEESEEETTNEDEEEDDEDEKKKRAFAPPVIMANVLSQQMPTGEYQQAAMFGVSQTSLLGTETIGANLMVYDNLKQYMLNLNYSKVHINDEGRVNRVYSASVGGMKMFTTYMGTMNHSLVFLGKKGLVTGVALGTSVTSVELDVREGYIYYDDLVLAGSLTGFATKPFQWNERLTISPMLAVSNPFVTMSLDTYETTWNTDVMVIGGTNFTYNFTKRFGLNIGVTAIEATIKGFPTLVNYMIGGRFSF